MADVIKYPFSAVIVHYQHNAALRERLNIGIVLVCRDRMFIGAKFQEHLARISAAFPGASLPLIRGTCKAITSGLRRISERPSMFDGHTPADLVHQIIPPADAAIAISEPLRGVTSDPASMLEDLFHMYIDVNQREGVSHRDEQDVWSSLQKELSRRHVPKSFFTTKLVGPPEYHISFKHVWKNGHYNALQPVSFDLSTDDTIRDKAASWIGRLHTAAPWAHEVKPHIVVAHPPPHAATALRKAADDGQKLLRDHFRRELKNGHMQILDEDEADSVLDQVANDFRLHHGPLSRG